MATQNRKTSPWVWVLVAPSVLVIAAIVVGILGMLGWLANSIIIAQTSVYQQAVNRAEEVAHQTERLGPNSGPGMLIIGFVVPSRAQFRVRFYGPLANTELRARARRLSGAWQFSQLDLLWREANHVEDLRTPSEKIWAAQHPGS
jgi:hypothetical protein